MKIDDIIFFQAMQGRIWNNNNNNNKVGDHSRE